MRHLLSNAEAAPRVIHVLGLERIPNLVEVLLRVGLAPNKVWGPPCGRVEGPYVQGHELGVLDGRQPAFVLPLQPEGHLAQVVARDEPNRLHILHPAESVLQSAGDHEEHLGCLLAHIEKLLKDREGMLQHGSVAYVSWRSLVDHVVVEEEGMRQQDRHEDVHVKAHPQGLRHGPEGHDVDLVDTRLVRLPVLPEEVKDAVAEVQRHLVVGDVPPNLFLLLHVLRVDVAQVRHCGRNAGHK
mmetsp:Transcript_39986/g.90231  ORF Transcript_39986/g.90231 Transcript_39986/m.90231 type:complete len:241 (+) Transcript_39986:214-936(+)